MPPRRNLSWSTLAAISGLLSVGPVGIFAQYTDATCLASFSWMDNSKGQIPCLVGAYLQGVCNGGNFSVPALPLAYHYTGPTAASQNQCVCSSVTYNIISACGLCQNQTIISWNSWRENCSVAYMGFSLVIPDNTAVPQWAFQDVTVGGMFNVTLAQAVGDSPESTAAHVQSTQSAIATSATVLASTTPLASVSSSASPGTTSNTGAIAGGVVGGLVGVALIATAVVLVMIRKKRSRISSFAQFTPSAVYTASTSFSPHMAQPKLYDPSDPATFPPPHPLTPLTRMTGSIQDVPTSATYSTDSLRPGTYRGTPEV